MVLKKLLKKEKNQNGGCANDKLFYYKVELGFNLNNIYTVPVYIIYVCVSYVYIEEP